jgi:hypothetical protein
MLVLRSRIVYAKHRSQVSIPRLSPVDCALALLQEQQTLRYRHRMAIRDVAKKLGYLVAVENAAMPDRTIIHVRETAWLLGQNNGSNSLPSRQVRRKSNAAHPIE